MGNAWCLVLWHLNCDRHSQPTSQQWHHAYNHAPCTPAHLAALQGYLDGLQCRCQRAGAGHPLCRRHRWCLDGVAPREYAKRPRHIVAAECLEASKVLLLTGCQLKKSCCTIMHDGSDPTVSQVLKCTKTPLTALLVAENLPHAFGAYV